MQTFSGPLASWGDPSNECNMFFAIHVGSSPHGKSKSIEKILNSSAILETILKINKRTGKRWFPRNLFRWNPEQICMSDLCPLQSPQRKILRWNHRKQFINLALRAEQQKSLYFFISASNLVVFTNTLNKNTTPLPLIIHNRLPCCGCNEAKPVAWRIPSSWKPWDDWPWYGVATWLEGKFRGKNMARLPWVVFFFWGGGSHNWLVVSNILYVFTPKIGEDSQFCTHIFSIGLETTNWLSF